MAVTTRSGKGSPLTHEELDANFSKIAGVEDSATADQTGAEIKALYEAESNAYTDTKDTKLSGIEANATADQTDSEVKTAYENNADTNAFTDAEQTKLGAIEAGATTDQTNAEIKTAYEANADTNEFSDAEQTKLSGIEASADVTDSTNVASAGAVMESDTTTASMSFVIDQDDMSTDSATKVPTQQSVKAYVDSQVQSKDTLGELGGNLDDITDGTTYKKMSATEQTKLSGIEASADVTDTTNVTSAGALMDSEVTNLAQVKAFDTTDYATSTQGTTADNALPLAGGTMTGDVSLGDNVKAKFGAGNDLQIYHDGFSSYIKNTTGDLYLGDGDGDVYIQGMSGAQNSVTCIGGGATTLHNAGVAKLSTTSTGIDVTGGVTCDGLTVDGDTDFTYTTPSNVSTMLTVRDNRTTTSEENYIFALTRQNSATSALYLGNNDSNNAIIAGNNTATLIGYDFAGTFIPSAKFNNNGDISFYEDTGTTPKFFWDASAESLGIGNTSPNQLLEVGTTTGGTISISTDASPGSASAKKYMTLDFTGYGNNIMGQIQSWDESQSTGWGNLTFSTRDGSTLNEALRIDRLGNVGIGTTSPNFALDVSGAIGQGGGKRVTLTKSGSTTVTFTVTHTSDGSWWPHTFAYHASASMASSSVRRYANGVLNILNYSGSTHQYTNNSYANSGITVSFSHSDAYTYTVTFTNTATSNQRTIVTVDVNAYSSITNIT